MTCDRHLVFVFLLCFLLFAGCRDASKGEPGKPADDQFGVVTPTPEKHAARPSEIKETSSSYESAIRLEPLSANQFPQAIPDNGARHGYATILESLGSGCAAVDFDRDGWPDALVAGGGDFVGRTCIGQPVFVLRNCETHFEDTTATSGIGTTRYYHHGICAADFDHDGFEDFLVTGFGGVQLFCNLGDGTFAESTAARDLVAGGWSASAAWGDFNHDGHLDVYVTGYVDWSFDNDPPCFAADGTTRDNCSPKIFEPLPDTLLISGGDGTFTDQTEAFNVRADGKTLGVVAADLDADGFLDLYVGNDVMMNFLYRNDSGKNFADWSIFSGAGVSRRGSPDASMGVDVVDFNNDGRFDIWAANFEMESFALYQNLGEMQFRHVSDITGVSAIGAHYVGWGTAFVDLDLDGDSDTVVCNGNVVQHPKHSPSLQKMVLLENIGGEYFEEVTRQAGAALLTPQHGRGLAWTDWNRDGKVDLLTTPTHAPAQLLQNESEVSGRSLNVRLIGTDSPRQPIGAIVKMVTSSGTQTKQLIGGGSYASTSLSELHFGIPENSRPTELRITWPAGSEQSVPITASDERLVVIEQHLPRRKNSDGRD
jgi:enediyne biosynthesis protein E4